MYYEDEVVQDKLRGIVYSLTSEDGLRDDLFQVAWFHLWQIEVKRPGQKLSWYLQSCWFAVQAELKRGCSIDSHKRRHGRSLLPDENESDAPNWNWPEQLLEGNDSVQSSACAHDLIESLLRSLTPIERLVLWDFFAGMEVNEIARKEGLTHQKVSTHRHTICSLASVSLGQSSRVTGATLKEMKPTTRKNHGCAIFGISS